MADYNSAWTSKPQQTLTYASQSDHVSFPHSVGYENKPSGYAFSSAATGFLSSASAPQSKRADEPPPTESALNRSENTTNQATAPGPLSNPSDSGVNFTAVVGVPNRIVERRPIDVLQKDHPDVFNLLLLAFESVQNRDESDDLSYYQLSGKGCLLQSSKSVGLTGLGIHGYPFISWQYPPQNPAPQLGYCTHSSAIFTTWHRPYVLLLEVCVALGGRLQYTNN